MGCSPAAAATAAAAAEEEEDPRAAAEDTRSGAPARSPPPPPLLLVILLVAAARQTLADDAPPTLVAQDDVLPSVDLLVHRWAPLVWLAPGERFFPSGVPEFLRHVTPRSAAKGMSGDSRRSISDSAWFLVTNISIDKLMANESSFLFGRDPSATPVPVYALATRCGRRRPERASAGATAAAGTPRFHVTYWMFYPFSQGKAVCSVDLGPLGVWPLPRIAGYCLGSYRDFGSHVGDWEHVSLLFHENKTAPSAMYVSAHDAGAFYRPSGDGRRFLFERQEVRRGLLQRPVFPEAVRLSSGGARAGAGGAGRPELFAARGSHGLWAAPGTHRYVRLPRLYDHSGYGTPWATWRALRVLGRGGEAGERSGGEGERGGRAARGAATPGWLAFRGRWGNPRSKCHPLARLGLALCLFSDGPTGIPLKKPPFRCDD